MYKHEILNTVKAGNCFMNASIEDEVKVPVHGILNLVMSSVEFHIDENFDKSGAPGALDIHKKIHVMDGVPFDNMLITTNGEDFFILEKTIVDGDRDRYVSISILICKYITLKSRSSVIIELFGLQYVSDDIAKDDHVWKDIASECHDNAGCIGLVYDRSVSDDGSINVNDHYFLNTKLADPYCSDPLGLKMGSNWVLPPTVFLYLSSYLPVIANRNIRCTQVTQRRRSMWTENEHFADFCYNESMRVLGIVSNLLLMCSCKNIQYIDKDHDTVRNERNALRLSGRFAPMAYKTICINPHYLHKYGNRKEIQSIMSVPAHVCRGHFAEYIEERKLFGKYTGRYWIPAHVRGNPELGTIEKDYEVKYESPLG